MPSNVVRDGDTVTVRDQSRPNLDCLRVQNLDKFGVYFCMKDKDGVTAISTNTDDLAALAYELLALAGEPDGDVTDDAVVFGVPHRVVVGKVRIVRRGRGEPACLPEDDGEPDWKAIAMKLGRVVKARDGFDDANNRYRQGVTRAGIAISAAVREMEKARAAITDAEWAALEGAEDGE